jgi:acetate---CoA ligase (ADP-forming)
MARPKLEALLRPRSVAVVGASREVRSVGGAVFRNLLGGGFQGPVYPINPNTSHVQSVRAYRSLREVPEPPDLVVVAVGARHVLGVVTEAAEVGAGALIVLGAGFAEAGPEGRAREQAVVEVARGHGLRLLGPNCLGAQNADPSVKLNATFAPTMAVDGAIAFASQSGAIGVAALDSARELGIGFSCFVSLGNKADLSGNDLLEWFEHDERTRAVLLYLESLGNPTRFREIATRVGRTKPIVMVKSGRSGAGARAAGSHTGAMAGPDASIAALCLQTGVIRADSLEQLFDVAVVLANQPLPKGRRIAVVTNAGGPGILAADALEAAGLTVSPLQASTTAALKAMLSPAASAGNPVDVLADVTPELYGRALEQVAKDPEIHAVVAVYAPPVTGDAVAVAQQMVKVASANQKPLLTCLLGTFGVTDAQEVLRKSAIPTFRFPEGAARALQLAMGYAQWREAPPSAPEPTPEPPAEAREVLARARARLGPEGGWLDPVEALDFCEAWGLTMVPQLDVGPTPELAEKAAFAVGLPAVIKAVVPGLVHKTEHGAVAVGLRTPEMVRAAVERMMKLGPTGFVIQPHVDDGEEWLVGAVRDMRFGPLVAVGAGGVQAELRQDLHHRLAPLSARDIEALTDVPRIARTLHGWRGRPPGDVPALQRFVRQLAHAAMAHPEIGELEANPLRVRAPGRGAMALDVRIHLLPIS